METIESLRTIDGIEAAKQAYHQSSGLHLAVTIRKNSVDMRITERPTHPIMLPITPEKRLQHASFFGGMRQIKVRRGE